MTVLHNPPHWNYYLLLERDLEESFRFVPPVSKHFGVYSDQFSRIILMACTEIENCLASFAFWTQCNPVPTSIGGYCNCVSGRFSRFNEMEVVMPRHSLGLHPWKDWTSKDAPEWWTKGYNKIKHDRLNHPDAPTLIRAVRSVSALLVLLLHFYRLRYGKSSIPVENMPMLFRPWEKTDPAHGSYMSWPWALPGEPVDS